MAASSLRNSLHRRNHKERGQLAHRSRLGLLEKHKDYVQRARDYHAKKETIHRLALKAETRNKDEFYFGMVKGKTKDGVAIKDRGNVAIPTDVVKLLKSQDANYIRTTRTAGIRKIAALKLQLTSLADLIPREGDDQEDGLAENEIDILRDAGILPPNNKVGKSHASSHILFVDSEEEVRGLREASVSGTPSNNIPIDVTPEPLDLGWISPGSTKLDRPKNKEKMSVAELRLRRKLAKENRTQLLKELSARLQRDRQLKYTLLELENQKATMGKGAAKLIRDKERVGGEADDGDDEEEVEFGRRKGKRKVNTSKEDEKLWKPRVWKWKQERKR